MVGLAVRKWDSGWRSNDRASFSRESGLDNAVRQRAAEKQVTSRPDTRPHSPPKPASPVQMSNGRHPHETPASQAAGRGAQKEGGG
jgi:hypothetical protein